MPASHARPGFRTVRAVVGVVSALALLASCGTDGRAGPGSGEPSTAPEPALPVQADSGTEIPVDDIDQFVAMVDVIAVGSFTGFDDSVTREGPDPEDPSGSTTEYGALTLGIRAVIKGAAWVEAGTTLAIRVGSRILDGDGEPISALAPSIAGLEGGSWESLVGDDEYLVFLTFVGGTSGSWAISSSQGILAVDDGVVSRLTEGEGPGGPDYTEVLDGATVAEARALLTR